MVPSDPGRAEPAGDQRPDLDGGRGDQPDAVARRRRARRGAAACRVDPQAQHLVVDVLGDRGDLGDRVAAHDLQRPLRTSSIWCLFSPNSRYRTWWSAEPDQVALAEEPTPVEPDGQVERAGAADDRVVDVEERGAGTVGRTPVRAREGDAESDADAPRHCNDGALARRASRSTVRPGLASSCSVARAATCATRRARSCETVVRRDGRRVDRDRRRRGRRAATSSGSTASSCPSSRSTACGRATGASTRTGCAGHSPRGSASPNLTARVGDRVDGGSRGLMWTRSGGAPGACQGSGARARVAGARGAARDGRAVAGLPSGARVVDRRRRGDHVVRGARRRRRGHLGAAAQGPVVPRLLRPPRGRATTSRTCASRSGSCSA